MIVARKRLFLFITVDRNFYHYQNAVIIVSVTTQNVKNIEGISMSKNIMHKWNTQRDTSSHPEVLSSQGGN